MSFLYKSSESHTVSEKEENIALRKLIKKTNERFQEELINSGKLKKRLTSFHLVSKAIASTLQFDEVAQIIVDEVLLIDEENTILSSVIYLLDEKRKTFNVSKVSRIPKLEKALKEIYTRSIYDRNISIISGNTLLRKVFLTKSLQIGKTLHHVIGNALPKKETELLSDRIGYKSFVCVPIAIKGNVFGALQIALGKSSDKIDNGLLQVLANLGDQVSIALNNARLYEEQIRFLQKLQQKTHDLTQLQALSQKISSSLNFNEVAQTVVDSIVETSIIKNDDVLLGAMYVVENTPQGHQQLRFLTMTNNTLGNKLINEYATPYKNRVIPITKSNKAKIVLAYTTGKTVIATSVVDHVGRNAINTNKSIVKRDGAKSFIELPLISRGKTKGILTVLTKLTADKIPQEFIDYLKSFASIVGTSLDNAQLYEEQKSNLLNLNKKTKSLEQLQKMSHFINATLDFKTLAQKAVDTIVKPSVLSQSDILLSAMYIAEKDENNNEILRFYTMSNNAVARKISQNYSIPFTNRIIPITQKSTAFIVKAFQSQKPQIATSLAELLGYNSLNIKKGIIEKLGAQSFIVLPLKSKGKVIGTLSVNTKLPSERITDEFLEYLMSFASMVGTSLENATLYKEQNLNLLAIEKKSHDLKQLQLLSTKISSSLDFKGVAQNIVDILASGPSSLPSDVAIGTLYILEEYPKKQFRLLTLSNNEFLRYLRSAYKTPYEERSIPLYGPLQSAVYRAYKTRKIQVVTTLAQLVGKNNVNTTKSPVVSKIGGVKSYIAIPLITKNRIIGALTVSARVPENELTPQLMENLMSFASHAAIALENANLYQHISEVNEQLIKTNIELKALDEAKNEFVSIASHQLRTPLTSLKGYLSTIIDGDFGTVPPQQKEKLVRAETNLERMTYLIKDLLDLSQIQTGKLIIRKSSVDIKELVQETVIAFYPMAKEKNIKILTTFPDSTLFYAIDADKIHQCLGNLIDNAIKYSPNNSHITVTVTSSKNLFTISVQDSGIGIPKNHLQWIFRKFFRSTNAKKESVSGTGIGLYVAQQIIELHGGKIWAESKPNKGSTFSFTLPKITDKQ